MTESSVEDVIHLLQRMEQRSRENAAGLPQQIEARDLWEGVLFMTAGARLVAPLNEVTEILNFPSILTRVPGTRPWMLGVANIRGNLLPIIDLQVFLGGAPVKIGRRSRVLVIQQSGVFTGLLVGDVLGMRHFSDDQLAPLPEITGAFSGYVQKAYNLDGAVLPVFSMKLLAGNPGFRMAAA